MDRKQAIKLQVEQKTALPVFGSGNKIKVNRNNGNTFEVKNRVANKPPKGRVNLDLDFQVGHTPNNVGEIVAYREENTGRNGNPTNIMPGVDPNGNLVNNAYRFGDAGRVSIKGKPVKHRRGIRWDRSIPKHGKPKPHKDHLVPGKDVYCKQTPEFLQSQSKRQRARKSKGVEKSKNTLEMRKKLAAMPLSIVTKNVKEIHASMVLANAKSLDRNKCFLFLQTQGYQEQEIAAAWRILWS